jgi:CGNR zinc finger
MTGQVEFDSHTSDVVTATVSAVNVATPGWEHGRPYVPPVGEALAGAVNAALRPGAFHLEPVPVSDVEELTGYLTWLHSVFACVTDGELDTACGTVNEIMLRTRATPVLSRHDGEAWHLHFHAPDVSWAVGWAGSMATALAIVLGGPAYDRLGVCSAPGCDRVYVDVSRNGARRFCSTACQNRVKAAAFRERRKV